MTRRRIAITALTTLGLTAGSTAAMAAAKSDDEADRERPARQVAELHRDHGAGHGEGSVGDHGARHAGHGDGSAPHEAVAQALGLSGDELNRRMKSGETLGEIADAQDVKLSEVTGALSAAASEHLGAAVKGGRISDAVRERILGNIAGSLERSAAARAR
jgi:hypothetical protein